LATSKSGGLQNKTKFQLLQKKLKHKIIIRLLVENELNQINKTVLIYLKTELPPKRNKSYVQLQTQTE
jgi:hypothetical protein